MHVRVTVSLYMRVNPSVSANWRKELLDAFDNSSSVDYGVIATNVVTDGLMEDLEDVSVDVDQVCSECGYTIYPSIQSHCSNCGEGFKP